MADTIFDLVVLGGGPAGYTCAIRASQYGLKAALIDANDRLGGTCLLWGCIPTKSMLFSAELWDHLKHADRYGIEVTPHSPYFGPGFVATIHIAAALVEKPMIEVLWLDMEANPFDPWVRAVDGKVRIPDGPGLGCDPDLDILKRYAKGATTRTERKPKP